MESGTRATDYCLLAVFCAFLLIAKALCGPLSQIEGLSLDVRILGESLGFPSYSSFRCTGMTQHQGIGINVLKLVAEVLGTPGKKWGG